jgi:HD-like signal output (HDOD) protein
VNSSAYSIGRRVSDVTQAITLLGLPTVRGLVLMHDLVVAFRADMGLSSAWIDGLTLHSVETSRLSGLLAAGTDWQSQAITAGLLHEVGQLVQASSEPVGFSQVIAAWHDASGTAAAGNDAAGNDAAGNDAEDVSLRAFEVPAFGVSHVEAGANLLSLWGLPTPVVHAVASHAGRPASAPADDLCSTVAIAHRAVEAEIGLVCGPVAGEVEAEWDERTREVVNRWRRERSGRAR